MIAIPSSNTHEPKSMLAQTYVTRTIDAYLIGQLDFEQHYCVPFEEDTLGKRFSVYNGHTVLYLFKDGASIVIYRDYLRKDYNYLDFYIKYQPNDLKSNSSFKSFLDYVFSTYDVAFNGTEHEIRTMFNAPKILSFGEKIKKWIFKL